MNTRLRSPGGAVGTWSLVAAVLLGVLAGLAMAVLLWWAILPVLVGVGIAVLAVKRALLLAHPAGGPSPAH